MCACHFISERSRVVVGAPNGTYPGGLSINNPDCPSPSAQMNNTGLVYLCSIQPGKDTCDGALGNGTTENGRLFDCQGTLWLLCPQAHDLNLLL